MTVDVIYFRGFLGEGGGGGGGSGWRKGRYVFGEGGGKGGGGLEGGRDEEMNENLPKKKKILKLFYACKKYNNYEQSEHRIYFIKTILNNK